MAVAERNSIESNWISRMMRTDRLADWESSEVTDNVMGDFLNYRFMEKFRNLAVKGAGWGSQGVLGLTTPQDFFECGDGEADAFGYFELYLHDQEEQVPINEFAQLTLRISRSYHPKNDEERSELPLLQAVFKQYCFKLDSNHMRWLIRNG